ncbi:MAG: MotA/TolQ/ExbB proton channel family protein [Oscillospiraceae bacterium]|nr:MotA/TolQ/ExbB proton channel family protein [Oscillospiraceae bacterium]
MDFLSDILHAVSDALKWPCIIVLLAMLVATVWQVGDLIVEYIVDRRKLKVDAITLLRKIPGTGRSGAAALMESSAVTKRQKRLAKRVLDTAGLPETTATTIVQELLNEEEEFLKRNLTPTDMIAKLGPMFGLLGTLIPLGPGIIALGEGDTAALASSIGVAFDTTVAGIIAAAICMILSHIRKSWYTKYMNMNEALAECLLEEVLDSHGDTEAETFIAPKQTSGWTRA